MPAHRTAPLDGVLFFPVTPFSADGRLNEAALETHVSRGVGKGPGGVFAACGTGEFHALDLDEYEQVVRIAVEATAGRVPVYAGTGGALPLARRYAEAAARAGADGLLLLPPYLVTAPPAGIAEYAKEVATASPLPLIVYQRNNARFTPETAAALARLPNVVGFKDGIGDMDAMQRIVLAVAEVERQHPFQFFNGLPTAEMTQLAFAAIGVPLYSSAVFCFAPEISLAFYRAVQSGDRDAAQRLLAGFYRPLVELRNRVPGYAVSLIKAAVTMSGIDAGPVRAPLVPPTREDLAELERIVAAGRALATGTDVSRAA